MKFISKEDSEKFEHSDKCTVYEYSFGDKDIDCAIAEISGRYPESGFVVNNECKELIYVLEGEGKVVTRDNVIEFKEGDAFIIESKEQYFWDARCKVLMPCTPAFTPDQYEHIEDEDMEI